MNQKPRPNPNINPVSNPNPNPYPYPKTAPLTNSNSLTYDEVPKFFSSPLADAADSLGVCTSVLKKICHENGLVRWPYRKFLSGKSIEQIKEDAVRGKTKRLNEVPKDAGRVSDESTISTVVSTPGIQLQNKITNSAQESLKSQTVMQLQGNKNLQTGSPQMLHGTNFTKGSLANTDEFIYGFPSDGLSTISYKWWGKSGITGSKDKPREVSEDISANSNTIASTTDVKNLLNEAHESRIVSLETGPLSSIRKSAVKEGREALKFGIHQSYATDKLDPTKRMVLQQIFKSSLPSQWNDESL